MSFESVEFSFNCSTKMKPLIPSLSIRSWLRLKLNQIPQKSNPRSHRHRIGYLNQRKKYYLKKSIDAFVLKLDENQTILLMSVCRRRFDLINLDIG